MSKDLIVLKLGGSLITDKRGVEFVLQNNVENICREISEALKENDNLTGHLIIGHGSGSFGHYMASKYGTRRGVNGPEQWMGFAKVSDSAMRLNRIVVENLLKFGIPAISVSPLAAATTTCYGQIVASGLWTPVLRALQAGLVPVIYGDVVFDQEIGGSIASTEELIKYLALNPDGPDDQLIRIKRILLAVGEVDGVLDQDSKVVPQINGQNYFELRDAIGGFEGRDVTGGMATKVQNMVDLCSKEAVEKVINALVPHGQYDCNCSGLHPSFN